jgi:hypothetical protein
MRMTIFQHAFGDDVLKKTFLIYSYVPCSTHHLRLGLEANHVAQIV